MDPFDSLAPWREAKHYVEACRQLADSRPFDWEKVDYDGGAGLGITNAVEDEVARVSWMSLDVALRGELVPPLHLDGKVNVRRAPGVRNGLDGPKVVLAARSCQEATKPLEVRVSIVAVGAAGMEIGAILVYLPDLDDAVPHGFSPRVEDFSAEMRDLAHGRRDRVVDDEQIVISVQRKFVGIKRTLGLPRRPHQCFSKRPRHTERHRAHGESTKETASRTGPVSHGHYVTPPHFLLHLSPDRF